MATIHNRSPYAVTVEGHPELTRKFPFARRATAEACLHELSNRHPKWKVQLEQEQVRFQVRLRKGPREQSMTFASRKQAEQFVQEMERQSAPGLSREVMPGSGVTTAQLIKRFIEEECPGLKGGKVYATLLNAMLRNSFSDLKGAGRFIATLGATSKPRNSLEWLHKPVAEVTRAHVQYFAYDRLKVVAPATVDRQVRLLNAVYKVAISKWGIHLDRLPTRAVLVPPIEARSRRLSPEEQLRLLDAARREDQMRSIRLRTRELTDRVHTGAEEQSTASLHERSIKSVRRKARAEALRSYHHVPLFEAFVMYVLATAARPREALAHLWRRVDFRAQSVQPTGFMNHRPRALTVPRNVLALLEQLPRSSERVFDIEWEELSKAWRRICKHANIKDLGMRDLRREALWRAAESRLCPPVLDLQAFDGHGDKRTSMRCTHVTVGAIDNQGSHNAL